MHKNKTMKANFK